MLSVVHVSKYGAYTCRGQIRNAVLAWTVALACAAGWARTDAARSATAVSASTNRRVRNRRVTEHQVTRCLLTEPTQPAELTEPHELELLRNFLYERTAPPPRQYPGSAHARPRL